MAILSPREKKILSRFKEGGDIKNSEEWNVLTKYCTLGLVSFSFLSKRARITDDGEYILKYY